MTHMPVTNPDSSGTVSDVSSFPHTWAATLAANANTNMNLQPAPGSYVPTTITAIRAGKVVGMQSITETLTAGTITFTLMINGVATALVLTQGPTAAHGLSTTGSIAFNAGDTIGVKVTTSSDQSPSSGWDALVWLEITESVS